jgi:hypothetical protein
VLPNLRQGHDRMRQRFYSLLEVSCGLEDSCDTDNDTASQTQAVQRPLVSYVFLRVRVPSAPPNHVNARDGLLSEVPSEWLASPVEPPSGVGAGWLGLPTVTAPRTRSGGE